MKARFEKGDLVKFKHRYLRPAERSGEAMGIIVDVLLRSPANAEWDKFLIYYRGQFSTVTGRQVY